LHIEGDSPKRGNINLAHAVGLTKFDGFDEGRHPTDRYYTKAEGTRDWIDEK
jgi:hypothetical protein